MPVGAFLAGRSFDPETLAILNAAFEGVCSDLGVIEAVPHSREHVAKMVVQFAEGQRDPQVIRKAVVAFFRERQSTIFGGECWNSAPLAPPLQNRTANAGRSLSYAGRGGQCLKNVLILTAGALDTIARQATRLVFGETASPRNTSAA